MKRLFSIVNVVIAASVGIILLLSYFFNFSSLAGFRQLLLQWAFILGGIAVLIGAGNLISVHVSKIRENSASAVYSLVLVIFLVATLVISLTPSLNIVEAVFMNGILVPAEISLVGLLAITLIYAGFRFLRMRADYISIIFICTVLLVLLGSVSLPFWGRVSIFSEWVRPFISNYLVAGGARGIIIGVALGVITTGLRIFFGADRPYGGK